MAVTKSTVEAMLSFLTKVTAVRVRAPAHSSAAQSKPLREQVCYAMNTAHWQPHLQLSESDATDCSFAWLHGGILTASKVWLAWLTPPY